LRDKFSQKISYEIIFYITQLYTYSQANSPAGHENPAAASSSFCILKLEIDELAAADSQNRDAEDQDGAGGPAHGQRPSPAFLHTFAQGWSV